jgi:catechol 2,3-dioxygenase-like lactoylglutathione lyase family enzyme
LGSGEGGCAAHGTALVTLLAAKARVLILVKAYAERARERTAAVDRVTHRCTASAALQTPGSRLIAGVLTADYTNRTSWRRRQTLPKVRGEKTTMPDASIAFDHVHLVSKDPRAAVDWYVEKLGGKVIRSAEAQGAPQISVSLGDAMIIVRGQRPAEQAAEKPGVQWGVDHFGMRVTGDFDGFCAKLRSEGVAFNKEPTDINPVTRIAFIQAPDGVSIELLNRKY